ncbi:hypothetical protein TNIN_138231 [Trichonephila inaurata madagascariensis]|uniref:Uncharacterized protein n=1 Tax=Trichonephila inaurata madagascariensis TaxID=2747483 RepID=A0A8X6Y9P8_9ARAC|nr:hypothetical protein TNIN_138231 [Trichonephila inaurata madagascariensis]
MVEQTIRTILPTITISMKDSGYKKRDLRIKQAKRNLNNIATKPRDETPFEMLHGYLPFKDSIFRKASNKEAYKCNATKEI